MIRQYRRGGRGGKFRQPPEKDPLVEAMKEAETLEHYLDLFRKQVSVLQK